ncbi:hypothetical protein CY35_11G045600, partial [Sphagnum magellanicum]
MITSIRNANLRRTKVVQIPTTNTTRDIGKILLRESFVERKKKKPQIITLRHISKPSLKIYSNHKEIPKVLGGMGIAILSTSQGIVTDRDTCQKQIGGNFLCYI